MKIGITKEINRNEKRVASTPSVIEKFIKLGFSVFVESDAGKAADIQDSFYQEAGATIVEDAKALWSEVDIVLKVNPPTTDEYDLLKPEQVLISFISPVTNKELLEQLKDKKVDTLAMECIPRISRSQKMDALSSMANIAGYRAIVEASHQFGRFFAGQITAAGKINPAKVLVIGAGVAGLSAISTAKNLGAVVYSFDTRPEVKEQVESMGAKFLMLDFDEDGTGIGGYAKTMSKEFINAEMALFAEQAKLVDIIVTTALIPGKPAPKLITKEMVESMKNGSVVVDLAAGQGGNCAYTKADQIVTKHGVNIIGYTDLPSRLANQSSQLYATNIYHLIQDMTPNKDGELTFNMEDEVIYATTVTKDGEITWPRPAAAPQVAATPPPKPKPVVQSSSLKISASLQQTLVLAIIGLVLYGIGSVAPPSFIGHFTVFVLSCFIGYMVVWNVTPSLHTPLMSVTNAVSSIIIIGALTQVSSPSIILTLIASVAIFITSINIVGGFAVTQRMLKMFRK